MSPSDDAGWRAYHDIRRQVLFEDRGRYGVYDEHRPDEHAAGNFAKLLLYDGEPIGTIRIDIVGTNAIFRRVAIRTTFQRQGHGRVLLALAEQFAQQNGCGQMMSYVAPDAVGFYANCGFELVLDDTTNQAVIMTRQRPTDG